MTFGNGDGPDGAVSTIEAGRVVELGSVNTRQIAEKSAQPQDKTADTAVRPVDPPDTLTDRSVAIDLRRGLPNERIEPFRLDRTAGLDGLARKLARWVGLPAKPQISRDGSVRRDENGKVLYKPVVESTDKPMRDAFSHKVIEILMPGGA